MLFASLYMSETSPLFIFRFSQTPYPKTGRHRSPCTQKSSYDPPTSTWELFRVSNTNVHAIFPFPTSSRSHSIIHWSRFVENLISTPGLFALCLRSLLGVPGLLVDIASRKGFCRGDLAGVAMASRSKYPPPPLLERSSLFSYWEMLMGGGRSCFSAGEELWKR